MTDYRKAVRLTEVAAAVDLQPLESGDPRYVDISQGRRTDQLKCLRLCLEDYSASKLRFAKIAFTGHRGCGKSTELLRLEDDYARRFTSLHLYADDALMGDYNYTDLFLWLVDALVQTFHERGTPLDARLAEDVATWFAEVSLGEIESVKKDIEVGTEVKAEAKAGVFWLTTALMGRLKSMIVGSHEDRREIRRKLQSYSAELIRRVDLLLDNAHTVLAKHGLPADLLIVVDNLDRLSPQVSDNLFFKDGDFLKRPRAHFIYTVPIAPVLAPRSIGTVFETHFTLPMVKVHTRQGRPYADGLDALVDVVGRRIDVDAVFDSPKVVRALAKMSGGNVRDLMRLVNNSQLAARVEDRETIDMASAKRAILGMRLDYERLLMPARTYYPLLAEIHRTKGDGSGPQGAADADKVRAYRAFFSEFLFNGSVLEYDGEEMWYDVHPVILDIKGFRKALTDAEGPTPDEPTAQA